MSVNVKDYIKAQISTLLTYLKPKFDEKADVSSLSAVATTGSYNSLSNKPTIPVVDQSLDTSSTNAIQNAAVANALNGKAASSHEHDSRYYTESEIDTALAGKANNTLTTPLTVSGGDGASAGKVVLDHSQSGQITDENTSTLFGIFEQQHERSHHWILRLCLEVERQLHKTEVQRG